MFNQAWLAGYNAFHTGKYRNNNPNPKHSFEYREWDSGYKIAANEKHGKIA